MVAERNLKPLAWSEVTATINKDLDSELERVYALPRHEGNYPSAIVIWFRQRDSTWGTHLAYRNGYGEHSEVRFEDGHYDFVSFRDAVEDARKRVHSHGGLMGTVTSLGGQTKVV